MERPAGEPVPSARDVRSVAHMKMLQSLGGKLNRLNDVKQIGTVIATELRALIDYHNCRVSLVEDDDVRPIAFVGRFTSETREPMEILACKVGEGITGRVAQTGESLLIGDAANCEFARILPGTDSIDESQVVVPLTFGTRVVGVIVISKLGLNQFDEADVRLLEVLAGHAAVALENAGLYEAARREAERATALLEFSRQLSSADGMDAVVDRIVELSAHTLGSHRASVWYQGTACGKIELRATHGYSELERERHARWITDLALKVGQELGLEGVSLKRLELGALFHDIGKIGIPETILSKPGPLTAEERGIVETHPELGEKIIAPIDRLEEVRPIVRHCHERYDGAGYPDRLAGDDIPVESRIIFVCDAYHAMTTDRPYRKRLNAGEALRRLHEAAGTQFDPRVVEVCARVLVSRGAGASPSGLPGPH